MTSEIFEAAATVGVETLIQPFTPPERWNSAAGVDGVAEELARAAERGRPSRAAGRLPQPPLGAGEPDRRALGARAPGRRRRSRARARHLLGGGGRRGRAGAAAEGSATAFGCCTSRTARSTGTTSAQLPLGSGAMPVAAVLEAATAAELAVLEFDDYAGDLFEGLAAGRAFATAWACGERRRAWASPSSAPARSATSTCRTWPATRTSTCASSPTCARSSRGRRPSSTASPATGPSSRRSPATTSSWSSTSPSRPRTPTSRRPRSPPASTS